MSCDICHPKAFGYTVYFSENNQADKLIQYVSEENKQIGYMINERMVWVLEPVFFDFLDYAEVHLNMDHIFAVQSDRLDPLKELQSLKNAREFQPLREASWVDEIIIKKNLTTHYQPIVTVENGLVKIVGQELLSRGLSEEGELISPFHMFEAARVRNRLFALDHACRINSVSHAGEVEKDQLIFINFLPTAIYSPEHCLKSTLELIEKKNIKPSQIVFEVVETDEVKNIAHLKRILEFYRKHGFQYALDDVGVGYNGINKIRELKPDYVKLALEYSNGVSRDPEKQKMAKSVLEITHELGGIALAEGVEEEEDFLYLQELGFDLFQGYYFSKPAPKPIVQLQAS
ncbi:EAL domain-containing protein [Cytobacillus gottheilii]|uniref:EAL domain-containing protein n=1 Tax=Cytobacillus gottheilii TaxID=859144 RepID=UPI0009B951CB|nr:EAL domain-containing protein [Cytobacillus gottheilii]